MSDFTIAPKNIPTIYAYTDTRFAGCLKIGYTERDAAQRVAEQYPVKLPQQSYQIVFNETALRENGTFFDDRAIHKRLSAQGFQREKGEWFRCSLKDVQAAFIAEKQSKPLSDGLSRTHDFPMRPEQQAAVEKTAAYFREFQREEGITPHFLWNAKMRFGKTFAAYQLAKEMGWKRVLVLTFKPAVLSAWREDLRSHTDFADWQFVSNYEEDLSFDAADKTRPLVFFGSFQDLLGKDKSGGIKAKNEQIHAINWDCVIFDEYHYGAWREKSKDLFDKEEQAAIKTIEAELADMEADNPDYFDEKLLPITTSHYLYLSGTPFRAISSGEFIEEQIFNWTYPDEQKAKKTWQPENGANPYAALPGMKMFTYTLPESIRTVAEQGEFDEFDLNAFFAAEGSGKDARFKNEEYVQKWLDLIRGSYRDTIVEDLKLGKEKPPMPFSDVRLLGVLQHTFWFLPNVAACFAMRNLIAQKQNRFYHDYEIIVCAGSGAGSGAEALKPVQAAMKGGLDTKTITLSCGKLTTGVSVAPWSGVLMLRNLSSPETYFQTAFRVQTPWVLKNPAADAVRREEIVKHECYIFDFAPNRALKQVQEYACKLDNDPNTSPEQKVKDFISVLPIFSYDGSAMREIDAEGVLDYALSGTTATLLAKRWESALLVNVDNVTLQRLLNSKEAMDALSRIEKFRTLNHDLETIINKSEAVKDAKKQAAEEGRELTAKEKKELSDAEKEYKSKRKEIQKKLIAFATRVPVFMYLSDKREHTLQDVITQLEPELFRKVTGLYVQDFHLLERLNVFNGALMNDAVFKFKRYEDSSFEYTGIRSREDDRVGGFNTSLTVDEHRKIYIY
ncbi:restriction enzyme [Neisseria bacilliformis ATCC BAA-1200]|uniref:Restriction enzyme n=1 Tax=Neisseria bacilliformis ATCC BAA-1200 TaxID=888742 RepID=F2BB38_9NEIS|nr:GIY-YIG nuclease family protein [Neisseria bacilliformis]EGF11298.1 restriction enzyme [Neisseria bacilliformis ATCC BAA-1200]QMT48072.1 GIY-YIG nuclease family protein [Neisseria bacilliformis]